jgi:DNA-binding SARP family transcriptional activator
MGTSRSSEQDALTEGSDAISSISLIERGLNCIQQGYCVEGAAFFRLACERLCSDQVQLATTLDALSKAIMSYVHAQQVLHEASKRFAEFDTEQQAHIDALKKLLPTVVEDTLPTSVTGTQPRKNSGGNQSLRLLRLPASTTDHPERHQTSLPDDQNTPPPLYITCFGHFEVRRSDPSSSPIDLCTNLKGLTILRYLITQPRHRETVDMLMAALWPEEAPEVAEHKLRVAISALRCSLNRDFVSESGGGYILCKGQAYQLNPSVQLHTDVDEFLTLYQAGQKASDSEARASYYEKACQLYRGPFLVEDVYAEWSYFRREELMKTYIIMCDKLAEWNLQSQYYEAAAKWASAILQVDRCDEEAHRQLIRAYAAQGRRSEALRQFQQCQRVLSKELGIEPVPETQKLFQMLLSCEDSHEKIQQGFLRRIVEGVENA